MSFSSPAAASQDLVLGLRNALAQLSNRGLKRSSVWAAEILVGLDAAILTSSSFSHIPPPPPEPTSNAFLVAKAYFDNGEYQRAAHILSPQGSLPRTSPLEAFVWAYACYLSGEKRKDEALREGDKAATNQALERLLAELPGPFADDGYVQWLHGVCLRERGGRHAEARQVLSRAVALAPWHWSAWLDLGSVCGEAEAYASVQGLPEAHLGCVAFRGHMLLEHQAFDEAVEFHAALRDKLPRSPFALGQLAVSLYGAADFDASLEAFGTLSETLDPFRLTNMDTLSNLYFVRDARAELSSLAHRAVRLDKFKAETCCVVGNYFSLKGQHEHAVTYFKRALKQNRSYLGALTLLGHEFVELKNLPAAIDAYHAAVELNPRDFRAWYGLGQAYEIAKVCARDQAQLTCSRCTPTATTPPKKSHAPQMHYYSLHYFRKTTTLRPHDARMWCALGGAYEKVGKTREAIKCFHRADELNDVEGIAAHRLARAYKALDEPARAADFYHKHLVRRQEEGTMSGPDVVEALRFLAAATRDRGQLDQALELAERLQRVAPGDREAESLLRDIVSRRGLV